MKIIKYIFVGACIINTIIAMFDGRIAACLKDQPIKNSKGNQL